MATRKNNNIGIVLGAEDWTLRCAGSGVVSRWRVHVTAISGTITVKAAIQGSGDTIAEADVVYPIGSTTAASTITAVGIYDVESSGLDITFSSGTSCTFSYTAVIG